MLYVLPWGYFGPKWLNLEIGFIVESFMIFNSLFLHTNFKYEVNSRPALPARNLYPPTLWAGEILHNLKSKYLRDKKKIDQKKVIKNNKDYKYY